MKTKINRYVLLYRIAFIILGAIAGYIYWYKIGCASGTCPITSQWTNTTLYGALLGYLSGDLLRDVFMKNKKNKHEQLPKNNK